MPQNIYINKKILKAFLGLFWIFNSLPYNQSNVKHRMEQKFID